MGKNKIYSKNLQNGNRDAYTTRLNVGFKC